MSKMYVIGDLVDVDSSDLILKKFIVTQHRGRREFISLTNDVISRVQFSGLVESDFILASPSHSSHVMI